MRFEFKNKKVRCRLGENLAWHLSAAFEEERSVIPRFDGSIIS